MEKYNIIYEEKPIKDYIYDLKNSYLFVKADYNLVMGNWSYLERLKKEYRWWKFGSYKIGSGSYLEILTRVYIALEHLHDLCINKKVDLKRKREHQKEYKLFAKLFLDIAKKGTLSNFSHWNSMTVPKFKHDFFDVMYVKIFLSLNKDNRTRCQRREDYLQTKHLLSPKTVEKLDRIIEKECRELDEMPLFYSLI